MNTPSGLSAHLKLLGMAAIWGASWPWGRIVAQAMPPLSAASVRFVLAATVLLLWLHKRDGLGSLRAWPARRWQGLALAALVGVVGYAVCFMFGLQTVPAGRAVLLITLNPVLTLLLAAWLFRERLNAVIAVGMTLAVAGAVLVISHGSPAHILDGRIGWGELLIAGCAVCWSVYTIIGRRLLANIDALATTAVTAAFGAVFLTLLGLLTEGPAGIGAVLQAPAQAWAALLALALGATSISYAWYFDGVRILGAGAAAAYITLVPIFGVIFSTLWLGESLESTIALGGAMAIAGMGVMQGGRRSA